MSVTSLSVTSSPIDVTPTPRPRLSIVGGTDVDKGGDAPHKLMITRRGRLALTLTTLGAVALVLVMGWSIMAPARAGTEVVVRPGQTLSEIAATELPESSLDRAIVEVQLANQMNTVQVQAGQTLIIP